MKSVICWFSFFFTVSVVVRADAGETVNKSVSHDGRTRTFKVYVPDGYVGDESWPLVLNMHGATGDSAGQINISKMNSVADANDFLVVYPEAVGGLWNDVNREAGQDDIGFLNSVLDDMQASYSVDASRIYSSGLSQGGAMSYLLSYYMPERIAAVASVAGLPPYKDNMGTLEFNMKTAPTTSRALPIMHIHGTSDPVIRPDTESSPPVPGSPVTPKLDDFLGSWVANNQCDVLPSSSDFADTVSSDESTVRGHRYGGCDTYRNASGELIEAEVVYFEVVGGGHTWPGGDPLPFGTTNMDINASHEIWKFFSRHTLPRRSFESNCDIDTDGHCDVVDLDTLTAVVIEGSTDRQFDLNGDSTVNGADLSEWLSLAATENGFTEPYLLGDTDLDGTIGASDLNSLALNWRGITNNWSDGDFNADGMVDASDLNSLALNWRDSISTAAATSAVPEPSSAWPLVVLAMALVRLKRPFQLSHLARPYPTNETEK